jgi:hypothetical protein
MGRAVCRKCWTWHGSGATVCPRCGAPLGSGNEPAVIGLASPPAATVPSQPGTPIAVPTAQRATRRAIWGLPRWGLVAIAAALVVGAGAGLLVLQWSSRAVSNDGTFSVQAPSGWERFTGTALPDGTTMKDQLLVLLGPSSDGVQARVSIYPRQAGFVDLGQLARTWRGDQATCSFSGAVGHFSTMTRATIAGSPALVTECRTPTISVEFITLNHANHTVMIGFSAASSQFDQLRDGALKAVLDSWRWN